MELLNQKIQIRELKLDLLQEEWLIIFQYMKLEIMLSVLLESRI